MNRITQNDVAKAAGVTRAAVSYVLNNRSEGNIRIGEGTRKRILEAAASLGYRVNLSARSLKTNRTQLLAMLVPDLGNPFYPMQIRGAQVAAHEAGYRLIIYDSFNQAAGEAEFLEMALHHVADGVLLSSFHLEMPEVQALQDAGISCVGFNEGLRDCGIDLLVTDQARAVDTLVDHLVGRGHRKIAHLTGDLQTANGRVRRIAFLEGLARHGLPARDEWMLEGTFLREGIGHQVSQWYQALTAENRPTALFAANDLMAVEAIKALKRAGVDVPQDLAVCGYDDIPEAQYIDPTLTTIGQDHEAIGRRATQILIDRIEGRLTGEPVISVFDSQLHFRQST
jgi:LacI family transcriptional regulator